MSASQPDLLLDDVLDNPVWSSLTGAHAWLSEGTGLARRYRPDVSPFAAVSDPSSPEAWRDLAAAVGPGGTALITGAEGVCGDGWSVLGGGEGVQLVETPRVAAAPDPEAVVLGATDVPEMLDLVARTEPGPFEKSTHTMGTYLGLRDEGRLVAMAGQRMHPDGWVEISAVCTAPEARGRGLARRRSAPSPPTSMPAAVGRSCTPRSPTPAPSRSTWVSASSSAGVRLSRCSELPSDSLPNR